MDEEEMVWSMINAAEMATFAASTHDMFTAFVNAGFTEEQALELVIRFMQIVLSK